MEGKNKVYLVNLTLIILMVVNQVKTGKIGTMQESEEKNDYRLMKLVESANALEGGNVKIKSLNERNNIIKELIQLGKETLKQLSNGETTETDRQKLLDEIYHFDEELFVESYKELLNEIRKDGGYHKIQLENLVSYTRKIRDIEQSLYGFITIFNDMKNNNQTLNREIFNLAHHVNDIKKMDNYHKVSAVNKRNVDIMFVELPECLKSILDSDLVYIKNLGENEYLYSADQVHLFDEQRRNLFTWVGGDRQTDKGVWRMVHIKGGIYHIYNDNFNEYMYAATFNYNTNRRYVFTWLPGGDVSQGDWLIELETDFCYIQNVGWGEYMYSAGFTFDDQRRFVFTWGIRGELERDKFFCWSMEPAWNK